MRAWCAVLILLRAYGEYFGSQFCLVKNLFSEVEPRANAFVGEVEYSWRSSVVIAQLWEDSIDGLCEVSGIGGSAYLVVHHGKRIAFFCEPQHRLDKVVAERRIEPCGTDDES